MSVGAQLQRARQERKLSPADVTGETKIQPWVLEALEADRLHELMSPIYAKGFLVSYAKFLRLEPEPLLAQFLVSQPEPVQSAAGPKLEASPVSIPMTGFAIIRRIGMAAAVGIAALGLITHVPKPWIARLRLPALRGSRVASLSAPFRDAGRRKAAELPPLTLLASQPLELGLTTNRTIWVQVRADGKLIVQQRLPRGARERWTASKQFELVVSQPSSVELTLNGTSISPFAVAHQGRLLITHRGVTRLPADRP